MADIESIAQALTERSAAQVNELSMMANHDNLDNQVTSIASDIHAAAHRGCSPWWVARQNHRRRIHLRKG